MKVNNYKISVDRPIKKQFGALKISVAEVDVKLRIKDKNDINLSIVCRAFSPLLRHIV